jgi:dTDP-4-dehydrorhamnose reductase
VRIAVTGARGQLGAAVVHECSAAHEVIALGRAELDITDDRAVARVVADIRPDAIVNAVGYNEVDAAEDHPVDALSVNAYGVAALARAASARGAALVHYGTDFVFDGTATSPYRETDRPGPRSVYAASKLLGEWFASDAPRAYVLRVESLFGRTPGGPEPRGTVPTMVRNLRAGREVRAFEDRIVSPTYILDAARATRHLLEARAEPGLYHCVNTGQTTWLEFARALAAGLDARGPVVGVRVADVALRASRPRFCALANEKLRAAGFAMPTWRDALDRYLQDLQREIANEVAHGQA